MTIENNWCCIYDCGQFDLICEESIDRESCELYKEMNEKFYDKPLKIKKRKKIRQLLFEEFESMLNGYIQIPKLG